MKANKAIAVLLAVAVALGAALAVLLPRGLDLRFPQPEPSAAPEETGPALAPCGVIHEPEFGGVYIRCTIEDFNALGFQYGDSVDVTFSNGYTLRDLPYYNGYYTRTGEPLLIAYPGYDFIKAAINSGDDLWEAARLREGDTAEITLAGRGKYLDIQNAFSIQYEDDRDAFENDAVFANFRGVEAGGIQPDRLFRSASPCDNRHNRAPYVDRLMGDAGVRVILNLADTGETLPAYPEQDDFASPNFLALYEADKVIPVGLNMNFGSGEFRAKLAGGLAALSEQPGPYLVHCTEGKDRTGFVCMLLEALCGASYDEIAQDYMITYDNYYGITRTADPERYGVIVENALDPMLRAMIGDDGADLRSADLAAAAEAFLLSGGMTDEQITALRDRLTA